MTFDAVPCRCGREEAPSCAVCGVPYPRRRVAIRFAEGDGTPRDLCPECVLRGPAGAAGEIRLRIAAGETAAGPAGRWVSILDARARAFASLESFPLAIRESAVRETRERR